MQLTTTKLAIYQVLPRLFGNAKKSTLPDGSMEQNGVGKFSDFSKKALKEIKKLGITHIWYTGILEHATQTDYSKYGIPSDHPAVVKGKAGSPYAIKDYYDICPDLADKVEKRMSEFENLVKRTHQAGIAVIIDFIPNHVARQYQSDKSPEGVYGFGEKDDTSKAFDPQNNFYYIPDTPLQLPDEIRGLAASPYVEFPAKATGNGQFAATPHMNDWYETAKLNYGVDYLNGGAKHFDPIPKTWLMMKDILLFWASKGVDGFRCDMAEIVPLEFWTWVIAEIKKTHPNIIFIAEIYNPALYHSFILQGGFDFLYDKVDLYDTLRSIIEGHAHAGNITHCWQVLEGLEKNMLRFLENHDEQRIASSTFATDPFAAIPGMVVAATMSRGPVMVYAGQEVGEPALHAQGFSGDDGRTSIFDYCIVPELQKWVDGGKFGGKLLSKQQKILRNHYKKLLELCIDNEVVRNGNFYDLQYLNYENPQYNPAKIYAYFRYTDKERLLIVVNFDRHHSYDLRIRLSEHVFHTIGIDSGKELIGTDIYTSGQGFVVSAHDCFHQGIPTHIAPKQALMFDLKQ